MLCHSPFLRMELISSLNIYFTVPAGGRVPRITTDLGGDEHVWLQLAVLFPSLHPDLDFGSPGLAHAVAFWHRLANYNMHFLSSHYLSGKQVSYAQTADSGKGSEFFLLPLDWGQLWPDTSGPATHQWPTPAGYPTPLGPSSLVCQTGIATFCRNMLKKTKRVNV